MIGSSWKTTRTVMTSVACLTLVFCAFGMRHASAQDSWLLRISEKEQMLNHTDPVTGITDPAWVHSLMWDTAVERMIDRNMPYIELTNTSPVGGDAITDLHLTIGDSHDAQFSFIPVQGSNLAVLGSTSVGSGVSIKSTTCGSSSTGCDELIVNFGTNGLAAGETVRFKIKLGVDANFAADYAASFGTSKPDYRTVLFNINASGGSTIVDLYNPSNNPVDDDNGNGTAFVDFGEMMSDVAQFENKIVDDINQPISGQFRDNVLRPYTTMDAVNLFQLTGAAEVPEPTSIGLAMLGVSGLFLRRRSRNPRLAA